MNILNIVISRRALGWTVVAASLLCADVGWAQERKGRERRVIKAATPIGKMPAKFGLRPRGPIGAKGKRAGSPNDPGKPAAKALPLGAPPDGMGEAALPGEKEFNSCRRYPRKLTFKLNLKPATDLQDLVATISQMTCKRFILADNLRAQKVTIHSPDPVTPAEAYRVFLSALDVMGLTVVPTGRYLKVVQGNWAIQQSIPTFMDRQKGRLPRADQVVTQLVRIQNVNVNELLLVVNKMKSRSGDVTAYKPTNTLIITDGANNIRRILRIVKELDQSATLEKEKIWVVRLHSADVDEVSKILSQLFTKGNNRNKRNKPKRAPKRGRKGTTAPSPDDSEVFASKLVSDPSSNSLIIVATPTSFARIASLIKKLDVQGEGVRQQIHVYYLENADADEISNTLANLAGRGSRRTSRNRRNSRKKGRARGKTNAQSATLFEGEMQISADKATNSLVIVAQPRDFIALRKVIRKLDLPRRQVFIEAYIMEVSLNKSRKLGFAYHGGGTTDGDPQSIIFGGVQHGGLGSLAVDPLSLMGLAVGARGALIEGSGELTGLGADIPGFGVFFQALQTNGDVNVLSSPHLLTTDNEEAEISVGQNVPFQGGFLGGGLASAAGAAGGNLGSLVQGVSVQRQDVALKLKLTPHVNESDMVRLELEQEVSDIADKNFNGLGPATSKRTVKTTVVVRDQQTVVIGGLMRDRITTSVSKVPLLGDLPILGYLFKHKSRDVQKTNLLIVLTPYVIRDQSDLRRIFKKKLRDRREFIERYTSFDTHDPAHEIDYRHKRGVLSEINRVAMRAAEEAKILADAKRMTDQVVAPVDMPEGMDTNTADSSSGSKNDRRSIKPVDGKIIRGIKPTPGRNMLRNNKFKPRGVR
jgi:general secretion pathway protein D